MDYQLTKDQQRIFDFIENSDKNILIHGKPGTGKTVLVHALTEFGTKHYTKGAPTGLAANNMGRVVISENGITDILHPGKTLHSLFGIPVSDGILAPDFNRYTNNPNVRNNILYSIKHLIIDEISMVRADVFDYIDRVLKDVKQNDLPFGGIQVIVIGDFFQLPPVLRGKTDKNAMKAAGWKSEFAFDAFAFKSFTTLSLTEVLRQKGDDTFIKLLHASRTGEINEAGVKLLNKQVGKCTDLRIRLTGTNKQAEEVNKNKLAEIKEPVKEYHANCYGVWPQFPADTVLTLKVGAQVLIKKNGADRPPKTQGKYISEVVNGSLGIITELFEGDETSPPKVMVKLRNGHEIPIFRNRWEQKIKEKTNGEWTERVVASFEQIPLQLAWAISMHKSQGQSFDFVHVDPTSIFAAGQLYVALSRARSLAGLSLERPVTKDKFWTNKHVLAFTKQIESEFSKLKQ